MCITVFMWQAHPKYPFLLLLNRDEFHSRPTDPLAWWDGGETILGGRDGLCGGTWLASTKDGKVAFLTNFREVQAIPQPNTRGDLPLRFLQSNKSPQVFAEELLKEAHLYNGFNLVLVDICTSTMVYVFNRPKHGYFSVTPGIHVLTNASLDTPWPKAERLRHSFKELIDEYGEGEFPIKEMVEKLMTNTIKDDEQCLLPGIHPPEWEFPASSIFVDTQLPLGPYGTRSSSALFVTSNKEVTFYEKHLDQKQWKESTVTYQIRICHKIQNTTLEPLQTATVYNVADSYHKSANSGFRLKMADNHITSFRSNTQRKRYESLFQKEMSPHVCPDGNTMIALGVSESVRYLVHQLGWDNFVFSDLSTFRNLTLEFLSSFKYEPNRGTYIHGGLVSFRMLGHAYHLTTQEIGSLGPVEYLLLLINFESVHQFTLPNTEKTSVHNKQNWLYDLEGHGETDPETPPLYHYTPGPPSPIAPATSSTVPPLQDAYGTAISSIQGKLGTLREDMTSIRYGLTTLRLDFQKFMDIVIDQFDRYSDEIRSIRQVQPPLDAAEETPPSC